MIHIKVRETVPLEKAFRRVTKACEKAGLIANIKKYQYFEKPTEERKRKINQARRKARKLVSEIEKQRKRKFIKL